MMTALRRDRQIQIRAPQSVQALIDRAAAAVGLSRSQFMLETSIREAENTLLEDLGSTSGTFVDGYKITRALLSKSSSVRLGDYDIPPSLIDKYLPAAVIDSSPGATQYAPHLQPPTDHSSASTLEFSGNVALVVCGGRKVMRNNPAASPSGNGSVTRC